MLLYSWCYIKLIGFLNICHYLFLGRKTERKGEGGVQIFFSFYGIRVDNHRFFLSHLHVYNITAYRDDVDYLFFSFLLLCLSLSLFICLFRVELNFKAFFLSLSVR